MALGAFPPATLPLVFFFYTTNLTNAQLDVIALLTLETKFIELIWLAN